MNARWTGRLAPTCCPAKARFKASGRDLLLMLLLCRGVLGRGEPRDSDSQRQRRGRARAADGATDRFRLLCPGCVGRRAMEDATSRVTNTEKEG